MKKNVVITVCDIQTMDGETEKIEESVVGTLSGSKKRYTIKYTEYDGEMTGCDTTITVSDGSSVSITRKGTYTTEMLLENGKRSSSLYTTPYGTFTIGIFAKEVRSDLTESGGTLSMKYTIDFNTGLAAENSLTISVAEGNKQDVQDS